MIMKIISSVLALILVGCVAVHYGYGPYIGLAVIASLFALPSLGNRITGVKS